MLETMQHKASGDELLEKFIQTSPSQAAAALEDMPLGEAVFWLTSLRAQSIFLCFEHMNPKKSAPLLRRLPIKQAVYIISRLKTEIAAKIMVNLPAPYKERLNAALEPHTAQTIQKVLSYPQGSAARLMQNNYLAFKTDSKIKEITDKLKILKNKMPFCVYITDKTGHVAGCLKTAELAFCRPEALAGSVMTPEFEKFSPYDTYAEVLRVFKLSSSPSIAVVDAENFLLGVISVNELLEKGEKSVSSPVCAKHTALIAAVFAALLLLFILFKYF